MRKSSVLDGFNYKKRDFLSPSEKGRGLLDYPYHFKEVGSVCGRR